MAGDSSNKNKCDQQQKTTARPKKTGRTGGWDEIESLFDNAKEEKRRQKQNEPRKQQHKRKTPQEGSPGMKKIKPSPTRARAHSETNSTGSEEWIDDGLGGKYNSEGFTGRIEDGVKIFKAHVLRKPNAGMTDKCPFDCDCCFI